MSDYEQSPTDEHQNVTPTQIEFARLISLEQAVRTMRKHQIDSKTTRLNADFLAAREWEKRVDKLIEVQQ